MSSKADQQLTGGKVNYYLAQVEHPQREDQVPYRAECDDIIRALNMTFAEGCEFKAIWRTAAARLGNGKPGQKALYDAEKRMHYAAQDVKAYQAAAIKADKSWKDNNPDSKRPFALQNIVVMFEGSSVEHLGLVGDFDWNKVTKWRYADASDHK